MSPRRLSAQRRIELDGQLSSRDRAIGQWLARLRLATGKQLEALVFDQLEGHSRSVVRGRALGRLQTWEVIESVERRIGGADGGSSSAVYRLSRAGHALFGATTTHPVRPYTDRFTAHTLAVTELAAQLTTQTRSPGSHVTLTDFIAEPACWHPDGVGGLLKPDAYLRLEATDCGYQAWIEVDLATESLPTIERKLRTYLDFVDRGQHGPRGLVPQVLISTPSESRAADLARLVGRLPPPAAELFVVATSGRAVVTLLAALQE